MSLRETEDQIELIVDTVMTPTAGHQFYVPPVHGSHLVVGLAANGDMLRLVEGHLALHPAGLACGADADVGLDTQHLWLRDQMLPRGRLVAAPAEGGQRDEFMSRESDSFVCTVSPLVSVPRHFSDVADVLEHAVTAVPPDSGSRDTLGHTGHQVFLPREVVVHQVFNLRGN